MFGLFKKNAKKEESKEFDNNEVNKSEEEIEEGEYNDGFLGVYNVKLLYEDKPIVNNEKIINSLKDICGDIDIITNSNDKMLAIAFKNHLVTYADDKRLPAQAMIVNGQKKINVEEYEAIIQQSWYFNNVEKELEKVNYEIIVNDFMASGLEYKERLFLFKSLVTVLVENTNCTVIEWTPCGQFISPTEYLTYAKEDELYPAVNVRSYNISNGEEGEMIVDTLGLAALGIPDLQCHFKKLDGDSICSWIYNVAYYIFENGDIVKDGNTMQGLKPEDKWICLHELSIVQPERVLIDINPGTTYAAGNR